VRFLRWVRWLWQTRNCAHPRTRPIHGDERQYGYLRRCLDCDKPLDRD
jgi:hypothetical protein